MKCNELLPTLLLVLSSENQAIISISNFVVAAIDSHLGLHSENGFVFEEKHTSIIAAYFSDTVSHWPNISKARQKGRENKAKRPPAQTRA